MPNELNINWQPIVQWTDGGSPYDLAFSSIGNGQAYAGDEYDLGATAPDKIVFGFTWDTSTSAPTATTSVELFVAWSHNGTDYAANVTGSAAQFNSASETTYLAQVTPVAMGIMSADASTLLGPFFSAPMRPLCRWVVPIVYNNSGQAAEAGTNLAEVFILPAPHELQ